MLELNRKGQLDTLDVIVEIKPDLESELATHGEICSANLKKLIKSYIGVTSKVSIVPPGKVARSLGKAVRVIDKRGA